MTVVLNIISTLCKLHIVAYPEIALRNPNNIMQYINSCKLVIYLH